VSCRSHSHCIARIRLEEEAGGLVKAAGICCVRTSKVSASRMVPIDQRRARGYVPRERQWAYTVVEILKGGDKLLRKEAEGTWVKEKNKDDNEAHQIRSDPTTTAS